MKIKLVQIWKGIKIYVVETSEINAADNLLMSKFVSEKKSDIGYNKFGKPYLKSRKFWFNLTHTSGYAAIAISKKDEMGLDIERIDRKIDFRLLITTKFNFQLYNRLNSKKEFIKQWTIRESAIKCYGDLTLNSIYRIKTNEENNVLKCEGKKDLQYHVFYYKNLCICVSKSI